MKRVVQFTGSPAEINDAATKECKRYLGRQYRDKVRALRDFMSFGKSRTQTLRRAYLGCGMMGIEGRVPVHAMVRAVYRMK
jgi:hypothetical protein